MKGGPMAQGLTNRPGRAVRGAPRRHTGVLIHGESVAVQDAGIRGRTERKALRCGRKRRRGLEWKLCRAGQLLFTPVQRRRAEAAEA